jgi:predicted alpha/beta hydrolase family esterase
VTTILMVPGLSGSGPEHWQTLWEKSLSNAIRVEQDDWNRPDVDTWIERLDAYVEEHGPDVVLVGHSLGSIAIVKWAKRTGYAVRGAMLVAPTDVERPDLPPALRGWAPIPTSPLPFPSVVVSSSDDTWVSAQRAQIFADGWCAEFIDAGPLGHINTDSRIGTWPQGNALLQSLLAEY